MKSEEESAGDAKCAIEGARSSRRTFNSFFPHHNQDVFFIFFEIFPQLGRYGDATRATAHDNNLTLALCRVRRVCLALGAAVRSSKGEDLSENAKESWRSEEAASVRRTLVCFSASPADAEKLTTCTPASEREHKRTKAPKTACAIMSQVKVQKQMTKSATMR